MASSEENALHLRAWDARLVVPTLPINWNGHWGSGRDWLPDAMPPQRQELIRREFGNHISYFAYDHISLAALYDAHKAGKALDEPLIFGLNHMKCPYCDEDLFLVCDGQSLLAFPPCPRPDGKLLVEFELNVPSGKLVIENDLRDLFPTAGELDVNRPLGKYQETRFSAEAGFAYGYVGNTCPGVYKSKDTYSIVSGAGKKSKTFGKRVAGVITDLWWYSIADADEVERRAKFFGLEVKNLTTVPVKPGVYKFTQDYTINWEHSEPEVHARFEWVRDSDPVADALNQYTTLNLTVGQCLLQKLREYPDLFGCEQPWSDLDEKTRAAVFARVADRLLCMTARNWHKNGFPFMSIDRDITPDLLPDEKLPKLKDFGPFTWYPLSEYAALGEVPVNESFAKLSFNICESILANGARPMDIDKNLSRARETMWRAFKAYDQLRANYPTLADPKFAEWVDALDREKWILSLDLKPAPYQEDILAGAIRSARNRKDDVETRYRTWKASLRG